MSNDLKIVISAVDKATAVVRRVNDNFSRMVRPIQEVQRATAAFSKETGLTRMGKSLQGVSRAAGDVAQKVGSIIAPLTAVVGVGSVAAIAELAKGWAHAGAEIARTSEALGMSVTQLQGFRGAGQYVGMSTDTLTGSLKGLGDTMQDAINGRAPTAYSAMIALGLSFKRNADGALDLNTAVHEVADGLARYKGQGPQAQTAIARALGVEQLLPLLRLTGSGIDELLAKVQASGSIMGGPQVAAARAFAESLVAVDQAVQGIKNRIASALLPILQPLVDRFSKWAAANQDLIASRVAEFVDGFAKAIQTIDWNGVVAGIKSFVDGVREAVDWVGGWKNALLIVTGIMAAPMLLSVINLGKEMLALSAIGIRGVIGGVGLMSAGFTALSLKMATMTATSLPGLSNGFLAAGASMETGMLGKFTQMAAFAPLAYEGGKLIGTALWKGFLEDTNIGDKIGRMVTIVRAAFGDADAKAALDAELNAKAGLPPTGTPIPGGRKPVASAPPVPTAVAKAQAEGDIAKLMGMGWTRAQAAGIAANIQRESAGNERAIGDNGKAFGLAQWHPDRQAAFAKWAGKDIRASNRDEQLAFINYELRQGGEQGAGGALAKARNAAEAAAIISRQYERPADVVGEATKRAGMAVALAGPPQPGPAVPTPYTTPAQAAAMQGGAPVPQAPQVAGAAQQGVITVQIDFANAPAGMKSRVETKGPVEARTRITYSMPGVA